MHSITEIAILAVLSFSLLAGASLTPAKTVRMPFTKRARGVDTGPERRDTAEGIVSPLFNDLLDYTIQIDVGEPAQPALLVLDTGSSDLWVRTPDSCGGSECNCPPGGCTYCTIYIAFPPNTHADFDTDDPEVSTTMALLNGTEIHYTFTYGSGEVSGFYITDGISIADTNIESIIIGVSTSADITPPANGIMGIGLPEDEYQSVPIHPGVIGALYSQGSISSNSYSLYLDDIGEFQY